METKKTNVLFGLGVIAFLAVTIILINFFKAQRAIDDKEYIVTISNIVKNKNEKIRMLARMLMVEEKRNQDLSNLLYITRNDLDNLGKKLAIPGSGVPAAVPAPIAAAK